MLDRKVAIISNNVKKSNHILPSTVIINNLKNIDLEQADSRGLQIVNSLVEQLSGKIKRCFQEQGTHYCIHFKELSQQSSAIA